LLNQAITADGDRTRALIQSIDKTNDSRALVALANEVSELRNEGRLRGVEGNITISNNNTATAVAQQQQAQQQQQQLAVLGANIAALYQQNQHIQQGVLNIGSGTVSGNSQTAANTRVS
jgi:lipopolysaccharide biosynthesis regulator YciM